MSRVLTLCMILLLVTAVVWAKDKKEKHDPSSTMAQSDAIYYNPAANGITDLAVDLVIPQFAAGQDTKNIKITYYYAGEKRQQFVVNNIPAQQLDLRAEILAQLNPYSQNIMPKTSATLFKGLKLKTEEVYRQVLGTPETVFYQLIGTLPDKNAAIKEQHFIFDKQGLLLEQEYITQNGTPLTVGISNTRFGAKWQISRMTFREFTDTETYWRIVAIDYTVVNGFSLPSHISVLHRGISNQPISGAGMDLDIQFQNYRINQGVATAALPQASDAATTGTPTTPTVPALLAPPTKQGSSPAEVQW